MFRRLEGEGPPGEHLPNYSKHYFMPDGLSALSIADGKVIVSQQIGTGGYVVIEHPEIGFTSQSMHLFNRRVQAGQNVSAGQAIGTIGFNPSGYKLTHLHFQLRRGATGSLDSRTLVDPAPFIANLPAIQDPKRTQALLILAAAGLVGYLAYRHFTRTSSTPPGALIAP
jgi:hypothetical protein